MTWQVLLRLLPPLGRNVPLSKHAAIQRILMVLMHFKARSADLQSLQPEDQKY